jgi:hypothetical protein
VRDQSRPRKRGSSRLVALSLLLACCEGPASSAITDGSHSAAPPPSAKAPEEPALLDTLAAEYRGTITPGGPVVARFFHHERGVTGSFFFESDGIGRPVTGRASGTHVVLRERTNELTLDVKEGILSGTYTLPQGPAAVHLEPLVPAAKPTTALVFKRQAGDETPAKDPSCKSTVTFPEVYGLAASVEAKINVDLAPPSDLLLPGKCAQAEYRVAYNADGILSIRTTSALTEGAETKRRGRTLDVVLATGAPVKLFGDVVKPKAERTFESAENHEIEAFERRKNIDAEGKKALDQALAFSPPFILEEKGVRLFADSVPPRYAAAVEEGVLVRYATLPRPTSPVAFFWGK